MENVLSCVACGSANLTLSLRAFVAFNSLGE
jgi:hypothetical protein